MWLQNFACQFKFESGRLSLSTKSIPWKIADSNAYSLIGQLIYFNDFVFKLLILKIAVLFCKVQCIQVATMV